MNNSQFYKELLDVGNDNSDLSDIGPEDLASIVKGADDMDDVLFGFKPKQSDSQSKKITSEETKTSEHIKSAGKSNVLDFPDGDPLADISLSDDDFYDVGKKSPSVTKKMDTNIHSPSMKTSQAKLTKSEKIANLFGLNDDEEVVGDKKKKQESAGDWLGFKDSPVKTIIESKVKPTSVRKASLTGIPDSDKLAEELQTSLETKKNDVLEIKPTGRRSFKGNDSFSLAGQKQVSDQNKFELTDVVPAKTSNEYNLPKTPENLKDKKSAIFDELFGADRGPKKDSRRNSTLENVDTISAGTAVGDGLLGQYNPSSGVSRRPGLGRRRDTTLDPTPITLFKEDWLENLDQSTEQNTKKSSSKSTKTDPKRSTVETSVGLPTWLGGATTVTPDVQSKRKQLVQAGQEMTIEKEPDKLATIKPSEVKPPKTKDPPEKDELVAVKETLSHSSEQSHQTALALQRTEAQLAAALELQTTQKSLEAVCVRQNQLLNCQEKQLAKLVTQQVTQQNEVERRMTAQQQRIQLLLEALSTNVLPSINTFEPVKDPVDEILIEKDIQQIKELEDKLQIVKLENEELRLRMKMMEKHCKMEFESYQTLHRKEIEFWEDQFSKQKELFEQMKEDYKEKISDLKQDKAALIVEHNERVNRLREESAEDMKQLMQFHKTTLEQLAMFETLVAPIARQNQKSTTEFWKPLDNQQLSEKEEELLKKERTLSSLQQKLESQKESFEKQLEENEAKLEHEKMKNEEVSRQLKQEQSQLRYKQQQVNQEKKLLEDQYHVQRKMLEEMQERVTSDQTDVATQRLALTEERARLEALAKLQGVSGTSSFDIVQSKAEVHGALEAARVAEMKAVEEGRKLKEKQRAVDEYQWKLREMEEDLVTRAQHLDRLLQISEAKEEASKKALEEAKTLEINAEEKMKEVERRRLEVREKEQSLMRIKLDIAQEEVRINKKKEQLEHFLPHLLPEEALPLQPLKNVIDPKMLIMKLRAEREFEAISKTHPVVNEN